MSNIFTSRRIWLEPGEVASLRATRPLCLRIARGRVWITLEGRSADHWLSGGQSLDIADRGLVVIEAVDVVSKLEVGLSRRHWTGRVSHAVGALAGRLHHGGAPVDKVPAACQS